MSERPTPMCNRAQFHRDNGHAREHSIVVSVEFARDLERQIAERGAQLEVAKTAMERLDPYPDEEIGENVHDGAVYCEISVGDMRAIRQALARIDAKGGERE